MDNQDELKEIYSFINDFWKYIKSTLHAPKDDPFWANMLDEAGRIAKAHGDHKLVKELLLTYIDYIDALDQYGKG